jgi:hypothetical protein
MEDERVEHEIAWVFWVFGIHVVRPLEVHRRASVAWRVGLEELYVYQRLMLNSYGQACQVSMVIAAWKLSSHRVVEFPD